MGAGHSANQTDVSSVLGTDFLSEARQQLASCASTIRHCLMQLDDGQIWWRPRAEMNSIGNLILHLAGNLRQRYLSDIGGEPFDRDRFGEFTERRLIPRDELLRRFDEILGRVDATLTAMPTDRLLEHRQYAVTAGTIDGTVQELVFRTLTHLAGHTQEILFMSRLQLGERYVFQNPVGVPPSMRSKAGC
jgi:Protein of unknown function (DUF1572)